MAQMNMKPIAQPPLLSIEKFRGINFSVTPSQIDQNESPDMLNVNIDERGALNKRTGYKRAYATSLGTGKINGLFTFHRTNGTRVHLLAHTTKLYTFLPDQQPTQVYDGLHDDEVHFFVFNDKCYIMDGVNYLVYNGATVSEVEPYIPTLTISRDPSGGGATSEDFNLLGAGFKDNFSADGVATEYFLSLTNLDATTVKAVVNNIDKVEGTDFSVDRINGKVTFVSTPTKGTNNVIITAYKTYADLPNRIKKCRFSVLFGGSNDTRAFVSGNPDSPNQMWRLGLNDPTYAPENGFYKLGSDSDKIQGFSKQYDYLVIEKERSKWMMTFQLNNGEPSFPTKPINDQVGTIAKNSIQLIENNPISLSKDGVYMLTASSLRDERNVKHISEKVDAQLLKEPNLDKATGVDFDRKYWLSVNGNVYLYDYDVGEWFIYDNIHADCYLEIDRKLYFGSNGLVYRFMQNDEALAYNDDGVAINAYWKSKHFTFGADELRKLVEKVFFSLRPNVRSSADLYYVTNKKQSELVKTTRMELFDFSQVDFNTWSFISTSFPQEEMTKIKAKKITHFQLILKNNKMDESMGILSIGIKYRFQSEVK